MDGENSNAATNADNPNPIKSTQPTVEKEHSVPSTSQKQNLVQSATSVKNEKLPKLIKKANAKVYWSKKADLDLNWRRKRSDLKKNHPPDYENEATEDVNKSEVENNHETKSSEVRLQKDMITQKPQSEPGNSKIWDKRKGKENGVQSPAHNVKNHMPIPRQIENTSEHENKGVEKAINHASENQNQRKILLKKSERKKGKPQSFPHPYDIYTDDIDDECFVIDEIIRNPDTLKLIEDFVDCFTCNSTLPEDELSDLKLSLFKRTSSVFVKLLNDCVEKTCTRVLNSDFMTRLEREKSVLKQDASCQTNFPGMSEGEGSEVQQDVLT